MTTVAHSVGLEVQGLAGSPGAIAERGAADGTNRHPPLRTEGREEGNYSSTGYRPPGASARLPGWLWEVCTHPEITGTFGQLYWYWERELWTEKMSPTQIHMLKP